MKKRTDLRRMVLLAVLCCGGQALCAQTPAGWTWAVQDAHVKPKYDRIEPWSVALSEDPAKIRLYAARNEYESVQILIRTQTDEELTVVPGTLTSDGAILPGSICDVGQLVFLDVTPKYAFIPAGWYPDPILPINPVRATSGKTTAIWLTWYVPEGTMPGTYTGSVAVRGGSGELTVPVEFKVWDFTLPKVSELDTGACLVDPHVFEIEDSDIYKAEAGADPQELIERYYKNLTDHRITEYTHGPVLPDIKLYVASGGASYFDAAGFERSMTFMMENGIRVVRFPGIRMIKYAAGGGHSIPLDVQWKFADREMRIFTDNTMTQIDPDFEKVFLDIYGKVVAYLKQKGWLENTIVSFIDEPDMGNARTMNGTLQIAQLFKKLDPAIRLRVTKWPGARTTALYRTFDHFEAHGTHVQNVAKSRIEEMHADDKKLTLYINGIEHFQFDGTRVRAWPWVQWTRGFDGSLSWCRIANWPLYPDLPDRNPWVYHMGSYFGILGEMMLLYPPTAECPKGPVNSVRWELFREGLEDWEYLNMLRKWELRGKDISAFRQQAVTVGGSRAPSVVTVTQLQNASVSPYDEPYTNRPQVLRNTRIRFGEQIEAWTKELAGSVEAEHAAIDAGSGSPVAGDPFPLNLRNLRKLTRSVVWYVQPGGGEETESAAGQIELQPGTTRLRCVVTYDDGSRETLVKYLTAK